MSDGLAVVVAATPAQFGTALKIRVAVFVDEQHVPLELEEDDDDHDARTVHLLALLDGVAVGTARLLAPSLPGGAAHIGRVAVLEHARGRHAGVALMRAAEAEAWRRHADGTWPRGADAVATTDALADGDVAADGDAAGAAGVGVGIAQVPAIRVELSAQESAVPFYEKLGYVVGVDRYLDAGIWHRDAVRQITCRPEDAQV